LAGRGNGRGLPGVNGCDHEGHSIRSSSSSFGKRISAWDLARSDFRIREALISELVTVSETTLGIHTLCQRIRSPPQLPNTHLFSESDEASSSLAPSLCGTAASAQRVPALYQAHAARFLISSGDNSNSSFAGALLALWLSTRRRNTSRGKPSVTSLTWSLWPVFP